jgi:hypothetical protein
MARIAAADSIVAAASTETGGKQKFFVREQTADQVFSNGNTIVAWGVNSNAQEIFDTADSDVNSARWQNVGGVFRGKE